MLAGDCVAVSGFLPGRGARYPENGEILAQGVTQPAERRFSASMSNKSGPSCPVSGAEPVRPSTRAQSLP